MENRRKQSSYFFNLVCIVNVDELNISVSLICREIRSIGQELLDFDLITFPIFCLVYVRASTTINQS